MKTLQGNLEYYTNYLSIGKYFLTRLETKEL